METTLVLLKPDAVQRWLVGKIISRFEDKGLRIDGMKLIQLSEEIVNEHYDFLMDKPFFPNIKAYMTSSPVVALALSWKDVIKTVRNLTWATNPSDALPWSIRWDFALTIDANVIHASDSKETAEIELKRFFNEGEILTYEKVTDSIVG